MIVDKIRSGSLSRIDENNREKQTVDWQLINCQSAVGYLELGSSDFNGGFGNKRMLLKLLFFCLTLSLKQLLETDPVFLSDVMEYVSTIDL